MKARVIPIAFLLAIISIWMTYYFSAEMFMAVPLTALALCAVFKLVFKRKIAVYVICFIWIALFMYSTAERLDYSDSVFYKYENVPCVVYGKVIEKVSDEEDFAKYVLRTDKVSDKSGDVVEEAAEKIEVTVEKGSKFQMPDYGDYICVKAVVHALEGRSNSGEIDYGLLKKIDSVYYSAWIENSDVQVIRKFEKISDVEDLWYVVRKYVFDTSNKMLSQSAAAFVISILVSEKKFLSDDTLEILQESGIIHLSAASGLHVNGIITLVTIVLGLVYIRRRNAMLVSIPILVVYIFVNGCSPSIIRASIMMLLFIVSGFVGRDYDGIIGLCFAGIVILMINPLSVFDAGFILSFSAVLAISLFAEDIIKLTQKIPERKIRGNEFIKRMRKMSAHYIKTTVSVCIAVQLVTAPIIAYFYEYIAPYSVITNLLVSWVLPVLMLFSVLMLVFGFLEPVCRVFAFLAEIIADAVLLVAKAVSLIPGARTETYITVGTMGFFFLVLISIHLFIRKKRSGAFVLSGICVLIIAIGIADFAYEYNTVRVSFVNVGQADGCVIKFSGGKAIVVDGGGNALSDEDTVFVPYMKRNGIKKVEYIFVSHFDTDHAKNVVHILEEFDTENVVLPLRRFDSKYRDLIEKKAREKNCNIIYTKNSDIFEISENIKAYVYAPNKYMSSLEENNGSMVMKLDISGTEVLFLGDMEAQMQKVVTGKYKSELKSDIVKIAHHGSEDAFCSSLIGYADPIYAVISCGDKNVYKHPDESVIQALKERNIRTFITAADKDITFYIRENKITKIKCYN